MAAGAGEITIRVVSSTEKVLDTKPGMREMFPDFSEKFPYKTKTILAFEELDGVDVCFFGMHVQEYPSECPPPNKRYDIVRMYVCTCFVYMGVHTHVGVYVYIVYMAFCYTPYSTVHVLMYSTFQIWVLCGNL